MLEILRLQREACDIFLLLLRLREEGAKTVLIHGSSITSLHHDDIDIYAEFDPEIANSIGVDVAFGTSITKENGPISRISLDIRRTIVNFDDSDVGGIGKPRRVIWSDKK